MRQPGMTEEGFSETLVCLGFKRHRLHAVELSQWSCNPCANCVDPSRPQHWEHDYRFFGNPVMWTRWMAGNAPHKSGRCRDESRSDKHTQTSLDLRYITDKYMLGSRYR